MKKHWSVDTTELEKDPAAFAKWRLEQAINWGIREGKISERELREYWNVLDLDPHKKKFLALLLAA
ncbi:MAG: hypothetical protein Q7S26_01680 [bacterium]|nr:hypothetical protein [bacterium]